MVDQDDRGDGSAGPEGVVTVAGRFADLRGQAPPAPFAPAEAVRRRGRQRARRQGAALGAAVVALLGLAAGTVVSVNQPEPVSPGQAPVTGSPREPTAPAPTEIPDSWLLTADELGPGWAAASGHELFETDPAWFWGGYCVADGRFSEDTFPSLALRQDLTVASWTSRRSAEVQRLDQLVELFPTVADAAANLRDVRVALAECTGAPAPAGVEPLAVAGTGYAGDEALLVEERLFPLDEGDPAGAVSVRLVAVVRVGAVVTTLNAPDAREPAVRELAELAADRLP